MVVHPDRAAFLSSASNRISDAPEERRQKRARSADVLGDGGFRFSRMRWEEPESGEVVDEDDAIGLDAVWACVLVLSQSISALPLALYKRDGSGNRQRVVDHPVSELVYLQPNDEMTSLEWRGAAMYDLLLRGNHISQVVRNGKGEVVTLWPLIWNHVEMKRREGSGDLVYLYNTTGANGKNRQVMLEPSEVLHLRGLSGNGLVGLSVVELSQELLGESVRAGKHSARSLRNSSGPGGVVEVTGQLSDEAYNRLKESWNDATQAGKVRLLEGGAQWKNTVMTNEEAQLLESRKWYRGVIASLMRVPPHLINDLERATFSNIEHQDLGFVKHTLTPWLVAWEQRLAVSLLTREERAAGYYFKHNLNAILRGDFASRMEGYQKGINSGILLRNEARHFEEMNSYEGGDVPLVNGNMMRADQAGANHEGGTDDGEE